MESPQLYEDDYFWFHRTENGWPPVPKELLDMARNIREGEANAGGMAYTFCGVPIQELTKEELLAALTLMMQEKFKPL